jgi:hypothetical protein
MLAGIFIYIINAWFFIPWFLSIGLYFGFIEIRVMCSHCPHYAEPSLKVLHCWANYGSPKLWKCHPGPMSLLEKLLFLVGLFWILLLPLPLLIMNQMYVYSAGYVVVLIIWKVFLRVFYCSRCINLACPYNVVKKDVKKDFLEKNPVMKNRGHIKK